MGGDGYFELTLGIRLDMVEVMGRGYVVDYCITSMHNLNREKALQIYVTDALKHIAENTAKFCGGPYMQIRFADLLEPPKPLPKSEEIIRKIQKKMGGVDA